MVDQRLYRIGDDRVGRVAASELLRMIQSGELPPDTPVYNVDGCDWQTASQLEKLLLSEEAHADGACPQTVSQPQTSPRGDSLDSTEILAVRFGALVQATKAIGVEIWCSISATWEFVKRLWRFGVAVLGWRLCKRRLKDARHTFGEKLLECGYGDRYLRKRIADLGQRTEDDGGGWANRLRDRQLRRNSTLQLAESVLRPEDVPANSETEFNVVVDIAKELDNRDAAVVATKSSLAPRDSKEWRRVGVGGVLACCVVLMTLSFYGANRIETARIAKETTRTGNVNARIEIGIYELLESMATEITSDAEKTKAKQAILSVTPLHLAASHNDVKLINRLLQQGANVNAKVQVVSSPTDLRPNEMPAEMIESLTPLGIAVINQKLDAVLELLRAGADPNLFDGSYPLIQWAAFHGQADIVRALIESGVDVNAQGGIMGKETALHTAARGGHLEVVEELVAAGANVNTKCKEWLGDDYTTPLSIAIANDYTAIASYLRQNGAFRRTLVFILPGTWGNDSFWPNVIPGKSTFGSELLAALGKGSTVYPFVWASGNSHHLRVQAASNLSKLIDEKSENFERVVLVGHSHGGNIALLAAGACKTRIDMVVCLATPHVYLKTQKSDGRAANLPVYCSPMAARNVDCIITLTASTDAVAGGLADAFPGLTENEAIRMTTEWREIAGNTRLATDSFLARIFGEDNLFASSFLNVPNVHNVNYLSRVNHGGRAHSCAHSRRIGAIIGDLVENGLTPTGLAYLRSMFQMPDADIGEPVNDSVHRAWITDRESLFAHTGWRLMSANIQLHPDAQLLENKHGSGLPDPFISIQILGEKPADVGHTSTRLNTMSASWTKTDLVVFEGMKFLLIVGDDDGLLGFDGRDGAVGWVLNANKNMQKSFDFAPDKGIYWKGEMAWSPIHF